VLAHKNDDLKSHTFCSTYRKIRNNSWKYCNSRNILFPLIVTRTSRSRSLERTSIAICSVRREENCSKHTDTVHAKPRIVSTAGIVSTKKICASQNTSKYQILYVSILKNVLQILKLETFSTIISCSPRNIFPKCPWLGATPDKISGGWDVAPCTAENIFSRSSFIVRLVRSTNTEG